MPPPPGKGGGNNNAAPIINGTENADLIDPTGAGAFTTSADSEEIFGFGGDDIIDGGAGNDTIDAGGGGDTVFDSDGDDSVFGGTGDDQFYDGAGSDTYNGGDGFDYIFFEGLESNYQVDEVFETVGKGRNKTEVLVGYEVTDLTTGDVNSVMNVETIIFLQTPTGDTIITGSDFAFVQFDQDATVDVLANDYIEGQDPGLGLSVSGILDADVDLDGDGVSDALDLIPDDATLTDFQDPGGVQLNDGTFLYLNPDDTITWDLNGVYDTDPGTGDPSLFLLYEASDGNGNTALGNLSIAVTYPTPPGDITFENMVGIYDDFTAALLFGYNIYQDGPNGDYWIAQVTNAGNAIEFRDEGNTNYDYDNDGDDEFRVWTEGNGTSHEMNITHSAGQQFDLGGMTFVGLDAGETATISFADASGIIWGQTTVTEADLNPDGSVDIIGATNVDQFTVEANAGGEFYIDDVFFA
ncbi:calcium-binding protein [Actibacterium pelagium]|uniref:Hemolysin-type calcium-binding repeat-containing protein n=1 Tax=Actibacterium pelagium TaxID=2029103 RepID=A0A917AI37_9RHOB|nr:hypothetical protein [Actibacterium pelagium]GGE54635.1 hypothetical protein GCM10011517_22850 [Actibacterium pelagium]